MGLRSPVAGPRIVPFGEARKPSDVLPNGRLAFRVTQRFYDTDRFLGGMHGAIDLGNYQCGDSLYASHTGYISNRRDIYGALIVEIRSSAGDIVGYGHVRAFARPDGTYCARGWIVGWVGDTGLGNVCHVHYYFRDRFGHLRDPWPLLDQNIAPPPAPTRYCKFNDDVDGVNIRNGPDARKSNIYARAYRDPKGIVRIRADGSDGARLASTSSRRVLKRTVKGPDGQTYNEINLGGGTFVQSRFMHRV